MPSKQLLEKKCRRLLKSAVYGRLATCGPDRQPYIIPVNYVWFKEKIYIHTGFQGKKLDNLRRNPMVCFEISSSGKLYPGFKAKDFSMRYWCVLVFGRAQEIHAIHDKLDVMNAFMEKYAYKYTFDAPELKDMQNVNVIEITVEKISGKVGFNPKKGVKDA